MRSDKLYLVFYCELVIKAIRAFTTREDCFSGLRKLLCLSAPVQTLCSIIGPPCPDAKPQEPEIEVILKEKRLELALISCARVCAHLYTRTWESR